MSYTRNDLISVRSELIDVATRRETVTYTALVKRVGLRWSHKNPLDRKWLGELLGKVSRQEYRQGRPLISAVVIRKGLGTPGKGFLGLEDFPKTSEFWECELKRVHDFWEWR